MLSEAVRIETRSSLRSRSIPSFSMPHPRVPLRSQVVPLRIAMFEQCNFFSARPSLQLFLAGQGLVHIVVRFKIEQPDHFISRSEAVAVMELMLEHAFVKIAAYSNVQSPSQASHDVDAVIAWIAHQGMIGECGMRRL